MNQFYNLWPELGCGALLQWEKVVWATNRGIKHDFPFINIRKVPREVLKTEGEAKMKKILAQYIL